MKKAKPSPAAYNIIPRIRDLTYEEWREFYAPIFDKVARDIWKNCDDKGIIKTSTYRDENLIGDELSDIRQWLELKFYEEYLRFKEGSDKRIFPSFPGGFYKWNYYRCVEMFLGYMLKGRLWVESIPHDEMFWNEYYAQLVDFFDEREKRVEDKRDDDLRLYFEEYVGVSLDDVLGGVFGFWWMGFSLREIATMMTVGNKFVGVNVSGRKKRGYSHSAIKRKMDEIFKEIEKKMGISKNEMRNLRDGYYTKSPV